MNRSRLLPVAAAAILAIAASSPALAVNASLDFLWNPDASNDAQVYLHISNMAYQPPREEVRSIYPKMRTPENDFPVLLFLASEGHVGLAAVWDLRSHGLTWVQVMTRLNIPRERIFVEMPREPGPPYGKAYGHWKKHPREEVAVTDDDIRYWTNVRTQARYFGVAPEVVVGWRDSGRTWKSVAASEYREKKGKERKVEAAGVSDDDGPGHSAHSKGKSKGHQD